MSHLFLLQIIGLSLTAPLILFALLSLSIKILTLKKFLSRNNITAVSAGLLTSLTFLDFLPHSLENSSPFTFSTTLLLSLIILLLIETHLISRLSFLKIFPQLNNKNLSDCSHYHHHHHHFSHQGAFSAMGCLLVCSFFDGIRLGSSLLIEPSVSFVTSVALLAHLLPEGLSVISLAYNSKVSNRACTVIQALLCSLFGFGILLTGTLHFGVSKQIILTFSTASLLYVTLIHLLPIAFQKENQKWFFISLILSSLFSLFH